jgi:Rod binding domain-containing protein
MKPPANVGPIAGPPPRDPRAELRKLSQQLEGVFLSQLFQAMRQSAREGVTTASPGEEMFTSMMDDALAAQAAARFERGVGAALYRQLARRLPDPTAEPTP